MLCRTVISAAMIDGSACSSVTARQQGCLNGPQPSSVGVSTMQFRILGPLEVHGDHGSVALGGAKPRAVLAVLLLHANEPVSAERLALALWGEDAPGGAVKTVQVHVSRLRKALGD